MTKPRVRATDPERVIGELLLGPSRLQALYTAVKLGIPELLADGPRSSTLLASTTGVHPGALHRLLRFLVADGYFELGEDGRFSLTALSQSLLESSETGMRGALIGTATRGWEVWAHLLHSVETGQPAFERLFGRTYFAEQYESPARLANFDSALAPGAAAAGRALAKLLTPVSCVADIGCGSGALLLELLRAWPAARAIAFDAAEPLELAGRRFELAKVERRIDCVVGDFFEAVPPGAELYILSLILHDWDDARCLQILRNCQAAMAPGARLVIVERVNPEDPRKAPVAARADLGMLVMTGGRERTLNEYQSLIERAGLRFDEVANLADSRETSAIQASRGLL